MVRLAPFARPRPCSGRSGPRSEPPKIALRSVPTPSRSRTTTPGSSFLRSSATGRPSPYDREKMLAGIRKVLVNRPVTEELVIRSSRGSRSPRAARAPRSPRSRSGSTCLPTSRSSIRWPMCGSRASTRTSRRSATSGANSASCSRRKSPRPLAADHYILWIRRYSTTRYPCSSA